MISSAYHNTTESDSLQPHVKVLRRSMSEMSLPSLLPFKFRVCTVVGYLVGPIYSIASVPPASFVAILDISFIHMKRVPVTLKLTEVDH